MCRHVGEQLAQVLTCFSLDVVGVVSDYAREARFLFSFETTGTERPNFICVNNAQNELLVSGDRGALAQVFSTDGKFLRQLDGFRPSTKYAHLPSKLDTLVFDKAPGIDFDPRSNAFVSLDGNSVLIHRQGSSLPSKYKLNRIVRQASHADDADRQDDSDQSDQAEYLDANGIAVFGNELFVCFTKHSSVKVFSLWQGTCTRSYLNLNGPATCAVHPNGELFVSEEQLPHVKVFDKSGNLSRTFGHLYMKTACGMAFDASGNVLVCDYAKNRVCVFKCDDGTYVTSFGNWGTCRTGFDRLCGPHGICVDDRGRIYVTEVRSNRVSVFAF